MNGGGHYRALKSGKQGIYMGEQTVANNSEPINGGHPLRHLFPLVR